MWTISAALSPFDLTPFWHFRGTDEAQFGFVGGDGFQIRFKSVDGTTTVAAAAPRCKCCNMQISQNICEEPKKLAQNLWTFSISARRLAARQPEKNGCTCVWIAFL